jgi:hypothetical protein
MRCPSMGPFLLIALLAVEMHLMEDEFSRRHGPCGLGRW